MLAGMQAPLVVRPPSEEEQQALAAGLRSADAFPLRRCQIVLASARGEHVPAIARSVGCSEQTVRNAIRAFDDAGVAALQAGSSRPHTIHRRSTPRLASGCERSSIARRGSLATRPACGPWRWLRRRRTPRD